MERQSLTVCENCKSEFQKSRPHQRFCSPLCRVEWHQERNRVVVIAFIRAHIPVGCECEYCRSLPDGECEYVERFLGGGDRHDSPKRIPSHLPPIACDHEGQQCSVTVAPRRDHSLPDHVDLATDRDRTREVAGAGDNESEC